MSLNNSRCVPGKRPGRTRTLAPVLNAVLIGVICLAVAPVSRAQATAAPASDKTGNSQDASGNARPSGGDAASPATSQTRTGKLSRWFELQLAQLYLRYRFVENSAGLTTANQSQHKETFKARFKFDRRGRYSINAGLFSGRSFIATWNNTGLGTGQAQSNLALKQLFFSAVPTQGLEMQYGGLYLARGESTEITSYDEDGYSMGQRVVLKRPEKFFFDEISVTYAYLGDASTPNINKRYHRIKQSNYHQFLVDKRISNRAAVSVDYTFEDGREVLREAIKLSIPRSRVLDTIRFENYQRLDVNPAHGFALHGEKEIFERLMLGGGYAKIDPKYGNLNADRFLTGKRLFFLANLQITPEFSLSTYLTRAVAISAPIAQRTRFDLIFRYNLLKSLQRTGLF